MTGRFLARCAFSIVILLASGQAALAQTPPATARPAQPMPQLATFLRDRGTGVATSMFGTYVRKGELLIYPFYEYYRDHNFEYKPEEFGFAGDVDFRGEYRAHEALGFFAYGITDDIAVEFEVAGIKASLDKSALDTSPMPAGISESGLGDVEGQIRWRWRRETERRPEWFSYGEVVIPHAKEKLLIGTGGWEVKVGTGLTRGFGWGTITARIAVEYAQDSESPFDLGEYAFEYLRRLSPRWRLYLGLEGAVDELSFISEIQWHVSDRVFARFNNGVALTSKATDWAPEVGVVFSLKRR